MAINENQIIYYPMELSRNEYNNLITDGTYPFQKIKIGSRWATGVLIPIADEATYRTLLHSMWNEEKKAERERRCMIVSPQTGKPIRCEGNCTSCDRFRDGQPISTDQLYEENGFEFPDKNQQIHEVDVRIIFEQLLIVLERKDPLLAHIFEELYHGTAQREIERDLGMPHATMTDAVKKMRTILHHYVTREDFNV